MIKYFISLFLVGMASGQVIDTTVKKWNKNLDFFSGDSLSILHSLREDRHFYGYINWSREKFVEKSLIAKYFNQTSDGGYIITGTTTTFGSGTSLDFKTLYERERRARDALAELNKRKIELWNSGGAKERAEIKAKGSFPRDSETESYMLAMAEENFELKKKHMLKELDELGSATAYAYARAHTPNERSNDAFLMKLDGDGNFQWVRSFGKIDLYEAGMFVQETSDGGFIMIGYRNDGEAQAYVVKTDSQGKEEWQKLFGTRKWTYAKSGQQTSDGGYIITGSSSEFLDVPLSHQLFLLKIDELGNKEWQTFFPETYRHPDYGRGVNRNAEGLCVQQTRDDGYIVTTTGGDAIQPAVLLKYDSKGNEEWRNDRSDESTTEGYEFQFVRQTKDGGYITASNKGLKRGLIKFDSNGDEIWHRSILNYHPKWWKGGRTNSIQQTSDRGFITTGSEHDFSILRKTDSLGNEEWIRFLAEKSVGSIVQQTEDGGYAVTVLAQDVSKTLPELPTDSYLFKTDSEGLTIKPSIPVDSARSSIVKDMIGRLEFSDVISLGYEEWIPENIYWDNGKWIFNKKIQKDKKSPSSLSFLYKTMKYCVGCYCSTLLFFYIFSPS